MEWQQQTYMVTLPPQHPSQVFMQLNECNRVKVDKDNNVDVAIEHVYTTAYKCVKGVG